MKFRKDDLTYLGGQKKWVDMPCKQCGNPIPMIYPADSYSHAIRHQQCPQEGGDSDEDTVN